MAYICHASDDDLSRRQASAPVAAARRAARGQLCQRRPRGARPVRGAAGQSLGAAVHCRPLQQRAERHLGARRRAAVAQPTRVTVVADTGAIYALIDASDAWHRRIIEWWEQHGSTVVIPVVILPEVAFLLQARIGAAAEEAFVRAVANGEFLLED